MTVSATKYRSEISDHMKFHKTAYFMMGDNRNNSLDSRYWKKHFVEKDAILAKAVFRYWPFSEIGKVE